METQGIITAHPKNKEEANAIKVVMKALKIRFEISKEDSYDPSLVAKVRAGSKYEEEKQKNGVECYMEWTVEYTLHALEDINSFKEHGDTAALKKIRQLVESIQKTPFGGIGKPEPLKYALADC